MGKVSGDTLNAEGQNPVNYERASQRAVNSLRTGQVDDQKKDSIRTNQADDQTKDSIRTNEAGTQTTDNTRTNQADAQTIDSTGTNQAGTQTKLTDDQTMTNNTQASTLQATELPQNGVTASQTTGIHLNQTQLPKTTDVATKEFKPIEEELMKGAKIAPATSPQTSSTKGAEGGSIDVSKMLNDSTKGDSINDSQVNADETNEKVSLSSLVVATIMDTKKQETENTAQEIKGNSQSLSTMENIHPVLGPNPYYSKAYNVLNEKLRKNLTSKQYIHNYEVLHYGEIDKNENIKQITNEDASLTKEENFTEYSEEWMNVNRLPDVDPSEDDIEGINQTINKAANFTKHSEECVNRSPDVGPSEDDRKDIKDIKESNESKTLEDKKRRLYREIIEERAENAWDKNNNKAKSLYDKVYSAIKNKKYITDKDANFKYGYHKVKKQIYLSESIDYYGDNNGHNYVGSIYYYSFAEMLFEHVIKNVKISKETLNKAFRKLMDSMNNADALNKSLNNVANNFSDVSRMEKGKIVSDDGFLAYSLNDRGQVKTIVNIDNKYVKKEGTGFFKSVIEGIKHKSTIEKELKALQKETLEDYKDEYGKETPNVNKEVLAKSKVSKPELPSNSGIKVKKFENISKKDFEKLEEYMNEFKGETKGLSDLLTGISILKSMVNDMDKTQIINGHERHTREYYNEENLKKIFICRMFEAALYVDETLAIPIKSFFEGAFDDFYEILDAVLKSDELKTFLEEKPIENIKGRSLKDVENPVKDKMKLKLKKAKLKKTTANTLMLGSPSAFVASALPASIANLNASAPKTLPQYNNVTNDIPYENNFGNNNDLINKDHMEIIEDTPIINNSQTLQKDTSNNSQSQGGSFNNSQSQGGSSNIGQSQNDSLNNGQSQNNPSNNNQNQQGGQPSGSETPQEIPKDNITNNKPQGDTSQQPIQPETEIKSETNINNDVQKPQDNSNINNSQNNTGSGSNNNTSNPIGDETNNSGNSSVNAGDSGEQSFVDNSNVNNSNQGSTSTNNSSNSTAKNPNTQVNDVPKDTNKVKSKLGKIPKKDAGLASQVGKTVAATVASGVVASATTSGSSTATASTIGSIKMGASNPTVNGLDLNSKINVANQASNSATNSVADAEQLVNSTDIDKLLDYDIESIINETISDVNNPNIIESNISNSFENVDSVITNFENKSNSELNIASLITNATNIVKNQVIAKVISKNISKLINNKNIFNLMNNTNLNNLFNNSNDDSKEIINN